MPGRGRRAAARPRGRITLFDPPWFETEPDRLRAVLPRPWVRGGEHGPCGLPSNQRSINPAEPYDRVRAHPGRVEAFFLGGNGFRYVGVITALQQDLGRPVLTANGCCCGSSSDVLPAVVDRGTG